MRRRRATVISKFNANRNTGQLLATAKRLRRTRAACGKFLALWALEQDKNRAKSSNPSQENRIADPMKYDWPLLYLGSLMDE